MTPGRRSIRALVAVVIAAFGFAPGASPPANAGVAEHRDIELFVSNGVFGEPYITDQNGSDGVWRLTGGALDGQELVLQMEIEPPEYRLAIESGPAVVFAGLTVDGGYGGDIGASQRVATMGSAVLPACDEAHCVLDGEVRIPLDGLDDAMDAFTRVGTPTGLWLTVELTVVRTFGAGTWLQILEFGSRAGIGTLGSPGTGRGGIWATVLFPSTISATLGSEVPPELAGERYWPFVEQLRRTAADDSEPLQMAPAFLHAALEPGCGEAHMLLSAHSAHGDIVWSTDVYGVGEIDDGFALPVGVAHALTVHSQEGVFAGALASGGEFMSRGEPLLVDARIHCSDDPSGRRIVVSSSALVAASRSAPPSPTVAETPSAVPATPAVTPGGTTRRSAVATPVPTSAVGGRAPTGVLVLVTVAGILALGLGTLAVIRRGRIGAR